MFKAREKAEDLMKTVDELIMVKKYKNMLENPSIDIKTAWILYNDFFKKLNLDFSRIERATSPLK